MASVGIGKLIAMPIAFLSSLGILGLLGLLFLGLVCLLLLRFLVHLFSDRSGAARALGDDELDLLRSLSDQADRMEQRMENLETILSDRTGMPSSPVDAELQGDEKR